MKAPLLGLFAFALAVFGAVAQIATDSVTVVINAPKAKEVLLTYEVAPRVFENLSPERPKRLPVGTFVFNNEIETSVYYYLDRAERVEFVRDASKKYWLAKTGDPRRDAGLNFEVALRKEREPYPTIEKWMARHRFGDEYVKDPDRREAALRADHEKRLKFLEDYATRHQLSPEAVAWWKQYLHYHWRATQLFLAQNKTWPEAYRRKLAQLSSEFANDSVLYLPPYREAASWSVLLLAQLQSGTRKPRLGPIYEAILANFQGKTRDRLLTNAVLEAHDESWGPSNSTVEERAIYLAQYFNDCQTSEYKEHVRAATVLSNVEAPAGSVLTTQHKPVEFANITADAPVTYVDFWASWCGPCRAEMPASKKLATEYEAKGVRFVYVSMDENPVAWEKAAKQIGLADARSYLLPNPNGNPIVRQFKIKTIPRYLLLGRDGKVLNANAARPGETTVRTQLDAALKGQPLTR